MNDNNNDKNNTENHYFLDQVLLRDIIKPTASVAAPLFSLIAQ